MTIFQDANQDAAALAGLVNNNSGNVQTRTGGVKPCYSQVVSDIQSDAQSEINRLSRNFNFTDAGFDFATGGTVESANQLIKDASGNSWQWQGLYPHTVAPGTVPSSPNYEQRTFNEASNVSLSNGENLQDKVQSVVAGDGSENYRATLAVIRNTGSGWFFINDSGHAEVGFKSIQTNPDGTIELFFADDVPVDKIGSLAVTVDETFAPMGIIGGASISTSSVSIRLSAPLTAIIDTSAVTTGGPSQNGLQKPGAFGDSVTVQLNSNNITLNHPSVESPRGVTISQVGTDSFEGLHPTLSLSQLFTRMFFRRDIYSFISYNGTNFTASNGNSDSSISLAWETDRLRITHPSTENRFDVQISGRNQYDARAGSATNTTTDVIFYDSSGSQVTTPDTNMSLFFKRGRVSCIDGAVQNVDSGVISVNVGQCQIDANNLTSTSGNIWITGIMQI